ncbi:MAG TPA: PTS sugar transporter subunit IIA [Gammaproteobacteria bacterium]|nr:PTS sugar transporter subunit IIA [Gammaproteobacteria bacterium]
MSENSTVENELPLTNIITPSRVVVGLQAGSKKRLLEELAELLANAGRVIDKATVFRGLLDRERLGSTVLGQGVALPHTRISDLEQPIGALIILDTPIYFEETEEVQIACALLVPAESSDDYLKLVAKLAELFSESSFREALLAAPDSLHAHTLLNLPVDDTPRDPVDGP